ncbi:MAG TPA: IS91 family transposase [Ignavibacteriales bacterium]|nr:IS91 family transposase [Ignavibacteriales bacterium]
MEIADIFRKYGGAFREKYRLPLHYIKVMNLISVCRTSSLGGHLEKCDQCGYQRNAYNSCRNRHCPKCQYAAKEKWIDQRKSELLPIPYYHIVFTIPEELNNITLINKKEMYSILFKSASETLLVLGKDPKHLGAEIGIIAVLHTWGQNLMDHPHLHCIVTGGGLSKDKRKWIKAKKAKHKNFFIHVNVLSDLFKKKFLYYFKKAQKNKELRFIGKISELNEYKVFQRMLNELYTKKWITYCKRPFGGAEKVVEYLGRYTHRVAISNNRIKRMENHKVVFAWKDYRDKDTRKEMELPAVEFIRRFMLHILPENFYKIRYYGILSSRNKQKDIARCREILGVVNEKEPKKVEIAQTRLDKEILVGTSQCPNCRVGTMHFLRINIRAA